MIETICAFFGIKVVTAVILLGLCFVIAFATDAARWIFRRPQ